MEKWKKNLFVVSFAEMIAITGFASIIPFLPLFIKQLGIHDLNQVAHWSGLLISAPALVVVIISPFWGFIADKVGRKPMIERAVFGGAITIFLMSCATNVYQLFFLRLVHGLLTGSIAACTALISANSPPEKIGYSLGLLQTGVFLGHFFGPLIGGISADIFGFKNSFRITAALLLIAGCLIFFLVEEKFTPQQHKNSDIPIKEKISFIFKYKQIFVMMVILFLVQFSVQAVSPILSLFVETIVSKPNTVSSLTGIMFALTGLASAVSALNVGKLIEKKTIPLLVISLLGAGTFFFFQGFVSNITQLSLMRIFLGIFYGSIIPIANTIISLSTPFQHKGKVFGISSSTTFLGNILGPMTGGLVMTTFNIPSVFFFTGGIIILTGLSLPKFIKTNTFNYAKV